MVSKKQLQENLKEFRGSEDFHKMYPNVLLTEGVHYLCEQAACYWLVDIVWSYQALKKVNQEPFQVYDLVCNLKEQTGKVTCTDGNDHILMSQRLVFTDFPLESIRLYYCDTVLMLPSEY